LGLSPRAGVHLVKALRAWAWLDGRDFATASDLADVALDVLGHRLELRDESPEKRNLLKALFDEELAKHEA
jgi:MoxR-like ATPase